jgi:small-conductance mechanosensitive channel
MSRLTTTATIAALNPVYSISNNHPPSTIALNPITPFSMSFSWNKKEVQITLKDGNDILKIAKLLTEALDKHDIEYNIKTRKQK